MRSLRCGVAALALALTLTGCESGSDPLRDGGGTDDRIVPADGPEKDGGGEPDSAPDAADAPADGGADVVGDAPADVPADLTADAPPAPFEVTEADFECLLNWTRVRRLRITNIRGLLDEALEVANSESGGVYPEGTIIQIIPGEAMVKRQAGFSPKSGDWEFFALNVSASGTRITLRGTTETRCFGCHADAEPQYDFVCEQDHGCDPVGLTDEQVFAAQKNDPRCP